MVKFHTRNRHQGRYDLEQLKKDLPEFSAFVRKTPYGEDSIDFADPLAVKCLNRALLKSYYGLQWWDIPENFLCPPIPGRADYIHHIADLLALKGVIPKGEKIRGLDIGVGANCIYPIIGHFEYGWSFVGTDLNPLSIEAAQKIVDHSPSLKKAVDLRLQEYPENILIGIMDEHEHFDFMMCNPPFHASLEEAQAGSRRKWNNLGKRPRPGSPHVNFGGHGAELWTPGGELEFILQMIEESVAIQNNCKWFSTLVSKEETLPAMYASFKKLGITYHLTKDMGQGQKKSRFVAWKF
jgi:23S rRNA (adenine1618-N6)-methyltransferase